MFLIIVNKSMVQEMPETPKIKTNSASIIAFNWLKR